MQMEKKDTDLFYKLYKPLLVYSNKKGKISNDINKIEDIEASKIGMNIIHKVRDYIYDHSEIIDSFVQENPENFSGEELTIIKSWKNFVRKEFYIFEYFDGHAAFFDSSKGGKIYDVFSLYSPFENVVKCPLPCLVAAVLMPFKGKIIYDGLIVPYNISFGPTIRMDLNGAYNREKSQFGMVTSLPFSSAKQSEGEGDAFLLKFYLKDQKNREYYYEEIQDLMSKNDELRTIYYQETGKHNAAKQSKKLKNFITPDTNLWFAIIDDVIVASGGTKEYVEKILNETISKEKRNFVYMFKVKGKK